MFLIWYTLQIVNVVLMEQVADYNAIVQMVSRVKLTQEFVMVDSVIQIGMGSTVKVLIKNSTHQMY